MIKLNSKFLFFLIFFLLIVKTSSTEELTNEEIAKKFKTDIEAEINVFLKKYDIESIAKEFKMNVHAEKLEIILKTESESALNMEVTIIAEVMDIDVGLKAYLEKIISRFSLKIKQTNFKLDSLKEDIKNMIKLEFQFAESDQKKEKIYKLSDIPDKEIKNDLLLDIVFEKNQIKDTIEFFITDEKSEDPENELNYIINLSNPKYDSIKLQLKKTKLNEKDAIEITVTSGYFNFNYIINFLSKRFLLKTIEDCFHKIKNEIYDSLEILNQGWDNENDNLEKELKEYVKSHDLYFNSENLKQSKFVGNCDYEFIIEKTSNFNLQVKFKYYPKETLTLILDEQPLNEIFFAKDFPIDSMYNPKVFPKLFIKDLINNVVSIVPLSEPDENDSENDSENKDEKQKETFFSRVNSDEMTKPFIEYIQENNNIVKLMDYKGEALGFDIEFIGIEFENERYSKSEGKDGKKKIYRVDYVYKPKERRAKILKRNLI